MPRRNDGEFYGEAERIQRLRPQWLVLWGYYSRRFWAYPLFGVRRRVILWAYYPDALIARMDEAEQELRIRIGEEGVSEYDGDTG